MVLVAFSVDFFAVGFFFYSYGAFFNAIAKDFEIGAFPSDEAYKKAYKLDEQIDHYNSSENIEIVSSKEIKQTKRKKMLFITTPLSDGYFFARIT